MDSCVRCLTNNPRVLASASSCTPVEGGGKEVLVAARSLVHRGARLLSHPLYGNFCPHQQPFRTVVLEGPREEERGVVDLPSLHLLEEALGIYDVYEGKLADPHGACSEDYGLLDFELIRETLLRYGLLRG